MNMLLESSKLVNDYYKIPGWIRTLISAIYKIIGPILLVVATAGIIYAIVVGVKFVRAEDKSQRDEAKSKLISVIVGIVVTAVLIALFYFLAWAIKSGTISIPSKWLNDPPKVESFINFRK